MGFGSLNDTYKQANKILNTITINDTKQFLEKQKVRQLKATKPKNSYVADEPLEEIQIDLADFTASASVNDGYRYLFVGIDIFTKFCHAVPVKSKTITDSVNAMKEIINVIGKPKQVFHDFFLFKIDGYPVIGGDYHNSNKQGNNTYIPVDDHDGNT